MLAIMLKEQRCNTRNPIRNSSSKRHRYDEKVIDSKLALKFQHFRVIKNYIESAMRI